MISGARHGTLTRIRHLVARAMARDLGAFVVPGTRLARSAGLDIPAAGLRTVATPRHASVLILIGDLPDELARATAVAYAQMPRPRAILAVGSDRPSVLPTPDIEIPAEQAALTAGVERLRAIFAAGAFGLEATTFVSEALRTQSEYVCPMHPEVAEAGPGSCPKCGMELIPREATGAMARHDHMSEATDHVAGSETTAFACPMHPTVVWDKPGQCPNCGMTLVPTLDDQTGTVHSTEPEGHRRAAAGDAAATSARPSAGGAVVGTGHGHGSDVSAMTATGHGGSAAMATDEGGRTGGKARPALTPNEHRHKDDAQDHAGMGRDTMDHPGMDHGSMVNGGFMSMVAMTKDLPRSGDGLPMEWLDAPFGPLFVGLAAGLALTLTLDGDTVERATVARGVVRRNLEATWPGPVATFADRLARLDPLAPKAHHLLAWRALEAATGVEIDEPAARARVGALERERAASHLGWLAEFAALLGDRALAGRAAEFQIALMRAGSADAVARLRPKVQSLIAGVLPAPLMRRRLSGIGDLRGAASEVMTGPVGRSVGIGVDARNADPLYAALGFVPAVEDSGDALARMRVRLEEIGRSIDLVVAAGSIAAEKPSLPEDVSGSGESTVETPRGAATLRVEIDTGKVVWLDLDNRSRWHAGFVQRVAERAELGDALVGVASLDLSPWEMDR